MASFMRFLKRKDEKGGIRIKYRPYQKALVETYEQGERFLIVCWARRLGKDMMTFSLAAKQCINTPNSTVFYMFPTQKQGKQMLLEAKTTDHKSIISSVVNENLLIKPRYSQKLYHSDNTIRFKNGSIIYIVDALNADTKVGGNIDLLVCSEAALYKNNDVIDYLIPSIIKAGGSVVIVSTPRFGSKFNKMFKEAGNGYYKSWINAVSDDAVDEAGNKVYTDEELELAKKLMSDEKFQQEYLCDLDTANELSIYARSFSKESFVMPRELNIRDKIFVTFDLGINDATSLTFSLINPETKKLEVIHHYHNNSQPTGHYISYLNDFLAVHKLTKNHMTLILPHDGKNRQDAIEYVITREQAYRNAGFLVNTIGAVKVLESIEVLRASIQHLDIIFWETLEVRKMVDLIKQYEWKTNKVSGENLGVPEHGVKLSASNTCDSLEVIAVSLFYDKYIKASEELYKDFKPRNYSDDWRR